MNYSIASNVVVKKAFTLIGPQVRTQNIPGKADKDIPSLWGQVMGQNMLSQIEHPSSETIYALYSGYEGDYTLPYDCLIGKEVSHLDQIPEGMTAVIIPEQSYQVFKVQGPMPQAIFEMWQHIWENDTALKRTYTFDFEVYNSPTDVDIYISIS
ncbi:GyrI-like domain-containing protein [Simkania negevensis]|uniref:Putative transcriptional regulator protein yobU n=1 Tax=Simkania negevensis (strain ATCC VR-1471 / DSM 27360 / Z) TaxID=331113 RepID=F8L7K7_SIMNZ|nr:GyrI-like domain-containing protein [Simkania negevensis]MCB1075653.1 AraC family transcriptional regulator [Simkania sp.]CCB88740.1 putative transcriptional regulator protein yobU [Simkania negevensis Z]